MIDEAAISNRADPVLVTGASGFIGRTVVTTLLASGFQDIRCLVRPSSSGATLAALGSRVAVVRGNLLSRDDCMRATEGVHVIYHLAAGTGTKSFADAFMNSVVTTRNLLDAARRQETFKRLVNISSFAVYSNCGKSRSGVLDESAPVEQAPELRGEAYCYAKLRQDELVEEYGKRHGLGYVIIRPGVVYGPGKPGVLGRVGLGTFGLFLHLGGRNPVPITYVDNCADAIVQAGIRPGIDGEIFNVVDDDLPSSAQVLRLYKKQVKRFPSIYLPRLISYALFYAWEIYSHWSRGQLPATFNRRAWHAYWKGSQYSNQKLKRLLAWSPKISTAEGLRRYLEACRHGVAHA